MSKKRTDFLIPPPPRADGEPADPPAYYPGQERFGDWCFGGPGQNVVWLEPGQVPPEDPDDPFKYAHHGEPRPQVKRKRGTKTPDRR